MDNKSWQSYSQEELIKQMSPTHWTPGKNPEEVMNQHIQKSLAETTTARSVVGHKLNISYGSSPTQVYDEYGTDLKEDKLIFLWIHGGFWQEGSKEISGHAAPFLHSRAVRNIVVEYSLAPKVTVAQIQNEIADALKSVCQTFPKAKIIVGGHSAGGQLTAMLLHRMSLECDVCEKIVGLFLVSGVYELLPLIETPLNNALGLTKETAEASSPLEVKEINPNFLVKKEKFRILIVVGEYDSPEFKRQAQEYHKLLHSSFSQTAIVTIEKEDHFTVVEAMSQKDSLMGIEIGKFIDNFA